VVEGETMVGGGSLPGGTLPTWLVAISDGSGKKGQSIAQTLAERLRRQEPALVGRVGENVLYLDPRSVLPEDDAAVQQTLQKVITDLNLA